MTSPMNGHTKEITFPSQGVDRAGTLRLPGDPTGPVPGLMLGNGFANLRQTDLPPHATALVCSGPDGMPPFPDQAEAAPCVRS